MKIRIKSNMTNEFCSTEIRFLDRQNGIKFLLEETGKHPVLLLSKNGISRWGLESLVQLLKEKGDAFIWISDISENPTQKDIQTTLKTIDTTPVDTVIAIGGGSTIDIAKGICAFYEPTKNNSYSLDELTFRIQTKSYPQNDSVKIIAVPTTSGTGSELTQWATIWDYGGEGKHSLDSLKLKPELALIIPELTLTMSPVLTLSTGLDALCHAVEAYWSKFTTPVVQEIAYRAIELIMENLGQVLTELDNIYLRENMSRASVLSALAFSQTRTTACHSISYPLTQFHNVPHGMAAAFSLSDVAKINKGSFPHSDELFELFERYGSIENWMNNVCSGVISLKLKSFGVQPDDLEKIADYAITKGRMDNNPVPISKEDIRKILERTYE